MLKIAVRVERIGKNAFPTTLKWNEVGLDKSERKKMNNKIEEDK